MNEKNQPSQIQLILINAGFTMTIAFTTMILFRWIFEGPTPLVMVLAISIVNGILFLLFFFHIPAKPRIMYAGFWMSITFTIGILLLWMANDVVDLIPMSLAIGGLLFLASMLFTNALNKMKEEEARLNKFRMKNMQDNVDEEVAESEKK
ncbi:MAG TPA: hypothetical protein VGB30_05245 [bacterium]